MDSFYDVPRRAPAPTPVEKILMAPVVPEVSIICPAKSPANYMSYNTWKIQQNTSGKNVLTTNKGNIINVSHNGQPIRFASPQNTSQFLKKQVRFESPTLQQRPSLTYEPFNPRNIDIPNSNGNLTKGDKLNPESKQNGLPLGGKTFEEIYLANVPTRQLDLSLIELPNNKKKANKTSVILEEQEQELNHNHNSRQGVDLENEIHKNKENELPKTYKEFLETQRKVAKERKTECDDSITDIFNYKRNKNFNSCKNNFDVKMESKELKLQTKDKKSNGFKNIQLQTSQKPIYAKVKKPELCLQNSTNPVRIVEIQQPKHSPLYNEATFKFPEPGYQHSENASYQSRFLKIESHSSKSDGVTQTSIACISQKDTEQLQKKGDSEPTNKDLLKIIAQQNEQLLILQKQVAMLLNRDQQNQCKPIEAGPQVVQKGNCVSEKCVTSTQNENFMQDIAGTPRKRGLSKFSIDMMTSFEVAIRPQHNKQNFINYEPKIHEVTESESVTTGVESDKGDKTVVDTSLHLQEPVKVREVCPSPEPSININMNDYDSSEDDEVSALEIGATFYRNLMGQVNNILKKAHVQTKEELAVREGGRNGAVCDKFREKTMSRVKEATLRHLKSIGVTLGPVDESDDFLSVGNDSKDYNPTEISFAVKQILMKYLPDDQLAKIAHRQVQPAQVVIKDDKPGIIPARPEFSFATVQYMKKYNLIPNNDKKDKDLDQIPKAAPKVENNPKILDITALKLQPKLL